MEMKSVVRTIANLLMSFALAGCVVTEGGVQQGEGSAPQARDIRQVDRHQSERLYNIMIPLLRAMNHPKGPKEARIGIINSDEINAANAGGGQFYVTEGLLDKANNQQLRGIMAHEIAHDDLGHVTNLQLIGAGLSLGVVLLEQLLPGSSAVTPIAGELIARGYSRKEEFAADRHGAELLRRAGYPKQIMIDALSWVRRASGNGGGGFLSTHPAIDERIDELRRLE